jgi:hypothetical protein
MVELFELTFILLVCNQMQSCANRKKTIEKTNKQTKIVKDRRTPVIEVLIDIRLVVHIACASVHGLIGKGYLILFVFQIEIGQGDRISGTKVVAFAHHVNCVIVGHAPVVVIVESIQTGRMLHGHVTTAKEWRNKQIVLYVVVCVCIYLGIGVAIAVHCHIVFDRLIEKRTYTDVCASCWLRCAGCC